MTVSGSYAYVADGRAGLQIIDVSNPTNCSLVGSFDTDGDALRVTVHANRIYVADSEAGLVVLPIFPNPEFTVRVDATPGVPFTLEAATDLSAPFHWTPLLTTNVPAMPFDFVDYDVKRDKPQKFYRVRQP